MGDTLNGLTLEQHERRCKQGIYPAPMVPVVLALVGRVRELEKIVEAVNQALAVAELSPPHWNAILRAVGVYDPPPPPPPELRPPPSARADSVGASKAASGEERRLLACYCHGEELVPYCPRHTPLPGEERE